MSVCVIRIGSAIQTYELRYFFKRTPNTNIGIAFYFIKGKKNEFKKNYFYDFVFYFEPWIFCSAFKRS